MRYEGLLAGLRTAYDGGAERRDGVVKAPWKVAERLAFLERLRAEDRVRLLEVGAGTGQDSLFFAENGLRVTAVDLSPGMVARCRAKGLEAYERDFLRLGFEPGSFDAAYALNCLLHVPNADLPAVLRSVADVLRPGGLFFLGVYAGQDTEAYADDDAHVPPRFFSFRTDETLLRQVTDVFELVDFHRVDVGDEVDFHFQSVTLRRPE